MGLSTRVTGTCTATAARAPLARFIATHRSAVIQEEAFILFNTPISRLRHLSICCPAYCSDSLA